MESKLVLDIARVKENPDDIGVLAKITISNEIVQEFRLQNYVFQTNIETAQYIAQREY